MLTILPPSRSAHAADLFDLLGKTFEDYFNRIAGLQTLLEQPSFYDWQNSRIGLLDNQLVTHVGVYTYDTRVGSARLKTAGLGYVATHGDHRKKGLMQKTITATLDDARQNGFDLSLLFGINDFYHRFGFSRAFTHTDYHLRTSDIAKTRADAKKLHAFTLHTRPELDALYNRHADKNNLVGTAVRPTWRKIFRRRNICIGNFWTASNKPDAKPAGFLVYINRVPRLDILEAVGEPSEILAAARAIANKLHCLDIRFPDLHHNDPLARRLRAGNVKVESRYFKSAEAMGAVLNLRSTLQKMLPELSRRAAASTPLNTTLTLAIPGQEVTLNLARKISIAAKTPPRKNQNRVETKTEMIQFILGTDAPAEIVAAYKTKLTNRAEQILSRLFPARHPMLPQMDQY
jgi:predicted N-acetyltransferase YhbS